MLFRDFFTIFNDYAIIVHAYFSPGEVIGFTIIALLGEFLKGNSVRNPVVIGESHREVGSWCASLNNANRWKPEWQGLRADNPWFLINKMNINL